MNVLETFYYLFKGDTTDLKKGQADAKKTTDALDDSVKRNNQNTQDLGASFVAMAEQAAAALGVVLGVGAAVKSAFNTDKYVLDIDRFSRTLGVNADAVEIWDRAVKNAGGESASVLPDIEKINDSLNRSNQLGGTAFLPMNDVLMQISRNGIAIFDSTGKLKDWSQVLLGIAQKFDDMRAKGSSQAQIRSFSKNFLGISDDTFLFLNQGLGAVQDQLVSIQKIGVANESDRAKLRDFAKEWGVVRQEVMNLGVALTGPILTGIQFLVDNFKLLAEAAGIAAGALAGLSIILAVFGFTGLIGAVGGLAAAFFTLAGGIIAATWPFLLFAAAVAGVWALLKFGPAIFSSVFDSLGTKLKNTGVEIKNIVDAFKELFGWFQKSGKAIEDFFTGGGTLADRFKRARADYGARENLIGAAQNGINTASTSPLSAQTHSSIINGSRSSNVTIGELNIQTQATDADGIGSAITGSLQSHINKTITSFDDGVQG